MQDCSWSSLLALQQLRERQVMTAVLLLCFAQLQLEVAPCSVLAGKEKKGDVEATEERAAGKPFRQK